MNPSYATQMEAHRKALKEWESQSNDTGRKPETSSRYDSDMAMYLNDIKRSPERLSIIQRNIQQMKEWASQGK